MELKKIHTDYLTKADANINVYATISVLLIWIAGLTSFLYVHLSSHGSHHTDRKWLSGKALNEWNADKKKNVFIEKTTMLNTGLRLQTSYGPQTVNTGGSIKMNKILHDQKIERSRNSRYQVLSTKFTVKAVPK